MKKFIFLFILSISILLVSCSVISFDPRSYGEYYYYVVRVNSYDQQKVDYVRFDKIYESDNLIMYVESGYSAVSAAASYISQEFDKHYNDMLSIYGSHTDVDNNGKIKILLLNINSSYSGSIVSGYFYPLDLLGQFNNGEILYMDLHYLNSNPPYIAGTIFHELQHLINFNVNALEKGREMSLWLNEALSESTSVLFSPSTAASRINEFNNISYYCFYTWELPIDIFANYPSASVFMNWLYKCSGNNSEVFKNIASSSIINDYTRVLNSVSYLGIGDSWDNLLLKWIGSVADNEISGAKLSLYKSGSNIQLYPGAVVAYSGSLNSYGNLVTTNLSSGIQLALNKDTYLGSSPSFISITVPNSLSSFKSSKLYNFSSENNENYKPKYRNILFDNDGKIKKY